MAKNIVFKVSADTTGVTTGMNQATQATNQATKSVSMLDSSLTKLGGAVAGAFAVSQLMDFGKQAAKVAGEFESIKIRLQSVQGGVNEANKAFEGLQKMANELGLEFKGLATNYVQFVGAAKASGMEVAKAEKVFKSMSVAIAGSGASAEQANRAMYALQNMIGKSKISAEELRGQLGEAMPSAIGIMAKSLGVTTSQLDKMMAKGELMANDVLPKFAAEMEKAFGEDAKRLSTGLNASVNRLTNSWESFLSQVGKSSIISTSVDVLSASVEGLAFAWAAVTNNYGAYQAERDRGKRLEEADEATKGVVAQIQKEIEAYGDAELAIEELTKKYDNLYFEIEDGNKRIERDSKRRLGVAADKTITDEFIKQLFAKQKTLEILGDELDALRDSGKASGQITAESEKERKAREKSVEAAIKLRAEMKKALKDIYKVDINNLPEASGNGAFPGALGEKYKRQAREKDAKEAEDFAKFMSDINQGYLDLDKKNFEKAEAQKTEIAKQQQEQRKANEVALYSGLASTAQAWGQRELSIQQANLDKRREQGVISEEQYLNQLKAIKRKQFMLDKLGAVAQIAINTAVGVSSPSNLALGGALTPQIVALGAIQAGLVIAQPIPYKKGTKRVPMVHGAVRGEDSVHAILTPGERVITEGVNSQPGYSALLDLAQDRKISDKEAGFLADVATSGMRPAKSQTIDPEVFGKAIAKHIPGTRVSIDENGIMVISERSTYESKRLRTRL